MKRKRDSPTSQWPSPTSLWPIATLHVYHYPQTEPPETIQAGRARQSPVRASSLFSLASLNSEATTCVGDEMV